MGDLCNSIGLVLTCLSSGSTVDVTASPSRYITQPFAIPILSPVLFMHFGDPYIVPFRIFDLLVHMLFNEDTKLLVNCIRIHLSHGSSCSLVAYALAVSCSCFVSLCAY